MRLSISPSEWQVLTRQLIQQGMNSFNANQIINKHKQILEDFKEELRDKKRREVDKFKKELERKKVKDQENKIFKFERETDEKLNLEFKENFYKIAHSTDNIGVICYVNFTI